MKYIRTEKGIYDIETAPIVYVDDVKCVEFWAGRFTSRYEKIIQESDTIEELCDRYVGISNNEPMIIKYEFGEYYDEYNDSYTKEELLVYDVIYGAIYTSKGLIYVAKMNDKGELELI